jgi:hypothetical protein
VDSVDNDILDALSTLSGIPLTPHLEFAPKKKNQAVVDAMDWLCHNDPNFDVIDDPSVLTISDLAGANLPRPLNPIEREKLFVSAMDWVRNDGVPNVDFANNEDVCMLVKLPVLPLLPQGQLAPATKKKVLEDALCWLRLNNPSAPDVDDATIRALSNISGSPISCYSPWSKESTLEEAMEWLRSNDNVALDQLDDPTLYELAKLADIPLLTNKPLSRCMTL